MLTKGDVSFEQLGPDCQIIREKYIYKLVK